MRAKILLVGVVAVVLLAGACSSSSKASPASSSKATGSSAPTAASTQPKGAPIVVGMVCTCSGILGATIAPNEDVYKAWIKTVNTSGGINGHPVQLVAKDDAGNPATSLSDLNALLAQHVTVIVDLSIVDQAWAKTVEDARVPVIGAEVTEAPFYSNPDFFPVGETIDALPAAFATVAKEAGATRLGNFYCAEAPICSETISAISAYAPKVGTSLVYNAAISATAPNYTAQCVAAKQANVQAILNGDADAVMERVAHDCSLQGYNPIYVSSGEAYDVTMSSSPGIKNNSWYESNDLPFFVDNPAIKAMDTAVNKYYPGLVDKPNLWTGVSDETWASGLLLEDAVKAGNLSAQATPSSAEILRGLNSIKDDTLEGLSPPLTFTAGQPHPVHCWFTFQVRNGTPKLVNNGNVTCEKG